MLSSIQSDGLKLDNTQSTNEQRPRSEVSFVRERNTRVRKKYPKFVSTGVCIKRAYARENIWVFHRDKKKQTKNTQDFRDKPLSVKRGCRVTLTEYRKISFFFLHFP